MEHRGEVGDVDLDDAVDPWADARPAEGGGDADALHRYRRAALAALDHLAQAAPAQVRAALELLAGDAGELLEVDRGGEPQGDRHAERDQHQHQRAAHRGPEAGPVGVGRHLPGDEVPVDGPDTGDADRDQQPGEHAEGDEHGRQHGRVEQGVGGTDALAGERPGPRDGRGRRRGVGGHGEPLLPTGRRCGTGGRCARRRG